MKPYFEAFGWLGFYSLVGVWANHVQKRWLQVTLLRSKDLISKPYFHLSLIYEAAVYTEFVVSAKAGCVLGLLVVRQGLDNGPLLKRT